MAKTKKTSGIHCPVTQVLKSERLGDIHSSKVKIYNNVGKKPTFARRHGVDNRV